MSENIPIDSSKRVSGSNASNFTVQIDYNETNNYNRICITDICIPKSYTLIDTSLSEDNFIITYGALSYVITLPEGNYSRDDWIKELETLLNATIPNAEITDSSAHWEIQYPTCSDLFNINYYVSAEIVPLYGDNGKLYMTLIATDTSINVTITTNEKKIPAMCLGLDYNTTSTFVEYTTPINSVHVYKLTSDYMIILEKYNSIYIHSNLVSENKILGVVYSGLNNYYSNMVTNQSDLLYRAVPFNNGIKSATFILNDQNGNFIDTNDIDINFNILLFRYNDVGEKINLLAQALLTLQ